MPNIKLDRLPKFHETFIPILTVLKDGNAIGYNDLLESSTGPLLFRSAKRGIGYKDKKWRFDALKSYRLGQGVS